MPEFSLRVECEEEKLELQAQSTNSECTDLSSLSLFFFQHDQAVANFHQLNIWFETFGRSTPSGKEIEANYIKR